MNNETDIIIPNNVIETIDEHFPKGDTRRGDALVVNAVAITEGFRLGKEEARKEFIDEFDKWFNSIPKHWNDTTCIDDDDLKELKQQLSKKTEEERNE